MTTSQPATKAPKTKPATIKAVKPAATAQKEKTVAAPKAETASKKPLKTSTAKKVAIKTSSPVNASVSKVKVRAAAAKPGKTTTAKKSQPQNPKAAAGTKVVANTKVSEDKPKKIKLIRDSYTMPADEHQLLSQLKQRSLANGKAVKKSELLRAGILSLVALKDAEFLKAVAKVAVIKTGRPAKE